MSVTYDIIKSWSQKDSAINSIEDILKWVDERNKNTKVSVEKVDFSYNGFWYYDEKDGFIRNKNNSFFQIGGFQEIEDDAIIKEQPLIIQNEIGYLGILCQKIDGVIHFLMQAKIEPGNVNAIQISPTIQATKSNFTRRHGGKAPAYLDYFTDLHEHTIVVDQIQSEQSSRFYKKRNRNIIVALDDDVEVDVLDTHKWMTLGQIKELMKIDNLVNMDTRTVLSCIPVSLAIVEEDEIDGIRELFSDQSLFKSIFMRSETYDKTLQSIFSDINDYKMYSRVSDRFVPLKSLKSWQLSKREISCKVPYDFKVVYCHIEIEGREVKYWEQPLVEAEGESVLGLFTRIHKGNREFLVKICPEIGCYDGAEIGPTVQVEPSNPRNDLDDIEKQFFDYLNRGEGIKKDVRLSEEGGRFYHEQNRNVIIEIDSEAITELPKGYYWVSFAMLNQLVQVNNWLNIQLRNLMSLIEI